MTKNQQNPFLQPVPSLHFLNNQSRTRPVLIQGICFIINLDLSLTTFDAEPIYGPIGGLHSDHVIRFRPIAVQCSFINMILSKVSMILGCYCSDVFIEFKLSPILDISYYWHCPWSQFIGFREKLRLEYFRRTENKVFFCNDVNCNMKSFS